MIKDRSSNDLQMFGLDLSGCTSGAKIRALFLP
jgi:hypothetical protein